MKNILFLIAACLVSCGFVQGQGLPSHPVSVEMVPTLTNFNKMEFDTFLAEIRKWSNYDEKWLNSVEKGDNDALSKHHKAIPVVPDWLPLYCQTKVWIDEDSVEACQLVPLKSQM